MSAHDARAPAIARGSLIAAIAIGAVVALFLSIRFSASIGAAVALPLALAVYLVASRRTRRHRGLARAGISAPMREVLARSVDFYRRLDDAERRRFEEECLIFLDDHTVTGPRGAPLSDRLRVLVAASAVILVFGRRGYRYPRLRDVVVYEHAFDEEYREGEREHILGMVHGQGPILLSAEHLERGFADARDGHNVGLHELAHVLDFEGGHADGVPTFMPWKTVGPWLEVMRTETAKIERGRSILDRYAAKNEAELFAVATEVFFERPRALAAKHPELYALLSETYGQDPAARTTS